MKSFKRRYCPTRWVWGFAVFILSIADHCIGDTKPVRDKPPIPTDLLHVPARIENDQNGIWYWRRAAALQTEPDDGTKSAILYAWSPEKPGPEADQQARIRNWLRNNREALSLVAVSLSQSNFSWLARNAQESQPELSTLLNAVRARLVEADQLAEGKDFQGAIDSLRGTMKLADMAIAGDAAGIHYFVGGSARNLVEGAIARLANRPRIPEENLVQLSGLLPRLDAETNLFARMLRVEFTLYAYPNADLKRFAEDWAKPDAVGVLEAFYSPELQRLFRIVADPGLLPLHPEPVDQIASIEWSIKRFRTLRTNAMLAWAERDDDYIEQWSDRLVQFLADTDSLTKALADEPLPLSRQAIGRAREPYLKIMNPVGRIMEFSNSQFAVTDLRAFRNRVAREAARAVVAAKIFEHRKGQLPATLQELVDAKLLDAHPADCFSGDALRYSKSRRIIWSVGEDQHDDGGTGPELPRWSHDDAIWKIPQTLKP